MRNTSGLKRGGSKGRPKGVPNRATIELKEFCSELINDPTYRARLLKRWRAGKVTPQLEKFILKHGFGPPSTRRKKNPSRNPSI